MKKLLVLVIFCSLAYSVNGQSRSVERFRKEHQPSLKMFFYKSTLKMYARLQMGLQQEFSSDLDEMPQISEMINGIEKIKFFNYEGSEIPESQLFTQLSEDIHAEGYEDLMTARVEGNDMTVMMKEKGDKPEGFVVFIQSSTGYSILDIEGYPDVNKILELSQFVGSAGGMSLVETFR
ncbi:DUF4252 domain-containing protein [uncultured Roseivirga sp.]|uniref:DUF4252 domain-containing protein n=1 Tax=uncultured Roseivirga sp. TaxID=543088 RepID=UPI000D7AFAB9|nr:DUF4252 domain-containing protein [uncultured Roseivirga sp.]PWL32173.1 MAG: hypothetical protein DCO95_03055 [Roseivirga sp. XM-24bin3]